MLESLNKVLLLDPIKSNIQMLKKELKIGIFLERVGPFPWTLTLTHSEVHGCALINELNEYEFNRSRLQCRYKPPSSSREGRGLL